MRDADETLLAELVENSSVASVFVFKIEWPVGTEYYSTIDATINGEPVYGYVKSHSAIQSTVRTDGFGDARNVDFTLFDQTGYFYTVFVAQQFYNIAVPCTVYLHNPNVADSLFFLYKGYLQGEVSYNIDAKELHIEVLFPYKDHETGYAPSIEDVDASDPNYDYWSVLLESDRVWPEVFGTVENIELQRLGKVATLTLTEEITYVAGSEPYALKVTGDVVPALALDTFYTCELAGEENEPFSGKVVGKFTAKDDTAKTATFEMYNHGKEPEGYSTTYWWYEDIAVTDVTEDDAEFCSFDVPDDTYWLENMTLKISRSGTGLVRTNTKCNKQIGLTCYTVQKSKTFRGITTVSAAKSVYGPKTFPTGSTLKILDFEKHDIFIVDAKYNTTVSAVKVMSANGLVEVPTSAYDVCTYDPDTGVAYRNGVEDSTAKLWIGTTEAVTYVQFHDYGFLRYYPQWYTEDASGIEDAVYASASNSINTDVKIVNYLLNKYSDYGSVSTALAPVTINMILTEKEVIEDIVPEILWQITRAIVVSSANILKVIDLQLLGVAVVKTIPVTSVDAAPVEFKYQAFDEVYTVIEAQVQHPDMDKELETKKYKNNVSTYGERVLECDYYAHNAAIDTYLNWWITKLSKPWRLVTFTTYLENLDLELWDTITVSLGTLQFLDPEVYSPLTNVLPKRDDTTLTVTGYVKELQLDPKSNTIKVTLQTTNYMGDGL